MTARPTGAAGRALVATDLDRTLVFSATSAECPVDDLVCVEIYRDAPLSYLSTTQIASLARVRDAAVMVPVTTRTPEQYRRITLPGAGFRYAVTSNGGAVLVDGVPDAQWRRGIDAAVADAAAPLAEVVAYLEARTSVGGEPAPWLRSRRVADDLFCYLVLDPHAAPAGLVADAQAWAGERGWNVSRQGRKVYAMPDVVCKSRALAHVRERLVEDGLVVEHAPVFAAGDGALDAEMLRFADAAVRPRHGELEEIGFTHPTVAVTAASGVRAGEEILAWFTAAIATIPGPAGVTVPAPARSAVGAWSAGDATPRVATPDASASVPTPAPEAGTSS